jgi:hypothetical protein
MGNKLLIDLGNYIKNQLTEEKADNFHEQYCALIEKCDTSDIWRQFAIWLLLDPDDGVIRFIGSETTQDKAINLIAQLYIDNCRDIELWETAVKTAKSAADAAGFGTPARAAVKTARYAACVGACIGGACLAVAYSAEAAETADNGGRSAAANDAHYERMANKLIELLKNAPMIHDAQSTHCKRIANKLGDLINKQESMVDNMDNAVEPVMDNSDKISFSISHHNGTKHIMRGKEKIEEYVKQLEYILPIMQNLVENYKRIASSIDIPVITIKLIDNGVVIETGQMSRRTINFDNPEFITVKLFKESKEEVNE